MTLRADMAADGAVAWFDSETLAMDAIYTPSGGEAVICQVAVQFGAQPAVERSPVNTGRGVRYLVKEAVAIIEAAAAPNPANGDSLSIDGITWKVHEVMDGNGIHWRLRLQKQARVGH